MKTQKCRSKSHVYFGMLLFLLLLSCHDEGPSKRCSDSNDFLSGSYFFYSETDTSENIVEFNFTSEGFETTGLSGYEFWYPAAPLSGYLDGCKIILHEYSNVQREGLPSPGGTPRYYYESLEGSGELFPDNDSIVLNIHYMRTENFTTDFYGNLYFMKIR